MSYILHSDVTTIAFLTNHGVKLGVAKDEDVHRTPVNKRYNYKWHDRLVHKHTISYVSSADAFYFNQWWTNGTLLTYAPEYDPLDVSTVVLTGRQLPAQTYEPPYDNLYAVKFIIEEVS